MTRKSEKGIVTVIIILIVVAVLAVGGYFAWRYFAAGLQTGSGSDIRQFQLPFTGQQDEADGDEIDDIKVQGTSDEVSEIEADLELTDLDGIDSDLLDIESEIDAALSE